MDKIMILSGKSGAGKDVTAHFMHERLEQDGKRVLVIHYGDAVKWVLKDYYSWDSQKDERGRYLLQHIGTDLVRAKFPDFWTTIVAGLISAFENEFDVAIIPDARFENEIDVVEKMCGPAQVIRVERTNADGTPWINPLLTEEQTQHPSETSLDNYPYFDYILHNDAGVDELREATIAILEDVGLIEKE